MKTQKINSDAITKLAQKDYASYSKGEKSYELLSWLRDELILCQYHKKQVILIEPRALSRVVSLLGYFREKGELTKCTVEILDSKEAQIKFEFDLTILKRVEVRRLNLEYNIHLEEPTEDKQDETYSHMI